MCAENASPADDHLELTPSGFAALMDAAADAMVIIDQHGIVLNFNNAAERLFGYSAGEIIGSNVNRLMPEPHARQHDGYMGNYLETGEARIIGIGRRVEAKLSDGRCIPVELSVGEYSESGTLYFVGILRDLSERVRFETALRESEARLREREQELQVTLDRAPIGIVSIDMEGNIIQANHAACDLMGYEETEAAAGALPGSAAPGRSRHHGGAPKAVA